MLQVNMTADAGVEGVRKNHAQGHILCQRKIQTIEWYLKKILS